MAISAFPVIDLTATGNNIKRLRLERGLTVRQIQSFFGFEEPQAIYKWQRGESLPSVDNLFAWGRLLDVPMDEILVPVTEKLHMVREQQGEPCCSHLFRLFWPAGSGYGRCKSDSDLFSFPALCRRMQAEKAVYEDPREPPGASFLLSTGITHTQQGNVSLKDAVGGDGAAGEIAAESREKGEALAVGRSPVDPIKARITRCRAFFLSERCAALSFICT